MIKGKMKRRRAKRVCGLRVRVGRKVEMLIWVRISSMWEGEGETSSDWRGSGKQCLGAVRGILQGVF
jgi:hypothetical protein